MNAVGWLNAQWWMQIKSSHHAFFRCASTFRIVRINCIHRTLQSKLKWKYDQTYVYMYTRRSRGSRCERQINELREIACDVHDGWQLTNNGDGVRVTTMLWAGAYGRVWNAHGEESEQKSGDRKLRLIPTLNVCLCYVSTDASYANTLTTE